MVASNPHPDDLVGLAAIAHALMSLPDVDAVYLGSTSPRNHVLFAIVSQQIIDSRTITPAPYETALSMSLRYGGYSGSSPEFRASLGNQEAASLLRGGSAVVWAFAAVGRPVAPLVYDATSGAFVAR